MPLSVSTRIDHANPATVAVDIFEIPVSETASVAQREAMSPVAAAPRTTIVNVHVIVNTDFAHFDGQGHTPDPSSVTDSAVSWTQVEIDSDTVTLEAVLDQAIDSESSCSPVTVIVAGSNSDVYYSLAPTVCFP